MWKVGDTAEVRSAISRTLLRSGRVTVVETRTYLTLADGSTWDEKNCRKVVDFKLPSESAKEAKLRAFELDLMPVRKNDPDTSKAAARKPRIGLRQQVYNLLRGGHYERPKGWTGKEASVALSCPLNSVTPRFAELRRAGWIKDSGVRRDGQIAWVLA